MTMVGLEIPRISVVDGGRSTDLGLVRGGVF